MSSKPAEGQITSIWENSYFRSVLTCSYCILPSYCNTCTASLHSEPASLGSILAACCKTQPLSSIPTIVSQSLSKSNQNGKIRDTSHILITYCYNWTRALCFCLSLHIVSYRTTSFIQTHRFQKKRLDDTAPIQEGCMREQTMLSLCIKPTQLVLYGKDLEEAPNIPSQEPESHCISTMVLDTTDTPDATWMVICPTSGSQKRCKTMDGYSLLGFLSKFWRICLSFLASLITFFGSDFEPTTEVDSSSKMLYSNI